jgi:hypothetical protein
MPSAGQPWNRNIIPRIKKETFLFFTTSRLAPGPPPYIKDIGVSVLLFFENQNQTRVEEIL